MNKYIYLLILLSLTLPPSLPSQTIKDYIRNDWSNERYQVHGDGTVTDRITGLMWMQCSLGQSYADGTCSDENDATSHNWQTALESAAASIFANYTDWRLPNIKELSSLAAHDRYGPAINSTIFPQTPSEGYWSASPMAQDSYSARNINFYAGSNTNSSRYINHHVRLVRSH